MIERLEILARLGRAPLRDALVRKYPGPRVALAVGGVSGAESWRVRLDRVCSMISVNRTCRTVGTQTGRAIAGERFPALGVLG